MNGKYWGGGKPLAFLAFVAPLLVVGLYAVVTGFVVERENLRAFHSEAGPVEQITAIIMLVTAIAAAWLAMRLNRLGVRTIWWLWYVLIGAGALFVCLEEISYGQHMLGWESPGYFQEYNKQGEMNLHNLYGDAPSSTLRKIANTALPVGAIVLPLWFIGRAEGFRRGHWTWYMLPRLELAVWVLIAALLSSVRKLGGFSDGHWDGSLSEFKELMWGCALLVYVTAMWARLTASAVNEAVAAESTGPKPTARAFDTDG